MNNWKAPSSSGGYGKLSNPDYSRLPRHDDSDDEGDWIQRQIRGHKEQVAEQDQHLEEIGRGVERLGQISLEVSLACL
jgi:hypothetical protein